MISSAVNRCGTHDKEINAIVCCHHVQSTDRILGFVENCAEPDNLQAWCDECERLFAAEGELTNVFRNHNDFKVVCSVCYVAIRAKHSRAGFEAKRVAGSGIAFCQAETKGKT
jgi:hypothetical protein